jgi:UDP-2,4-diacetamido-2,4,6-trideoxy-beta-L-altropyranose hydrolase
MRIAFRADASLSIGSGHVMRCLALAQELKAKGAEIGFFSSELPEHLAAMLGDAGFSLGAAQIDGGPWDWLVVDHYELGAEWEQAQRAVARRIMTIDDLANRPHDCDLLLDQNILGAHNPYAGLVPAACRLCLGPRYALLRRAFAAARERGAGRGGEVRRVFVCFGGGEAANHTTSLLRALAPRAARLDRVDVVVGPRSRFRGELEETCRRMPQARLHSGGEIAELLGAADLAIGAGGSMTWERACLGVPSLAFGIAQNQVPVLQALFEAGCALGDAWMPEPQEQRMAAWLDAVLDNPHLLRGIAARSRQLVDGRGAARIADALRSSGLRFRHATKADSDDILLWRNDPQVRARSVDSDEIAPGTHAQWMDKVLADPKRMLLVAEDGGQPVGVVRFDLNGAEATISVYRTPGAMEGSRGLIREATAWLRHNHSEVATVTAQILAGNVASRAAFRNAGYSEWKELLQCKIK